MAITETPPQKKQLVLKKRTDPRKLNFKKALLSQNHQPNPSTQHAPIQKTSIKSNPNKKAISKAKKKTNANTFVFIDASYYIFYRYCATKVWFVKHSNLGENEDCHAENPLFLEKFVKHFRDGLQKIIKKFNPQMLLFFQDSPKNTVWRMELLESYKEGREKNPSEPFVNQFFKYAYQHLIPENQLVFVEKAEGDDAIAVSCKWEVQQNPNRKICVITGDSDFLQLTNDNVSIFKLPRLEEMPVIIKIGNQRLEVDGETYIQHKILVGDKTDDIPKVYYGCGPKVAYEMIQNQDLLTSNILNDPERKKQYELNRKLIHFDEIPDPIQKKIIHNYRKIAYPLEGTSSSP